MANNYSETSFELPDSWPFEAKKEFVLVCLRNGCTFERSRMCEGPSKYFDKDSVEDRAIADEPEMDIDVRLHDPLWFGEDFEESLCGTVFEHCDGRIGWYNNAEAYLDECWLDCILQYIADKYKIRRKDAVRYTVAYTCSRPCSDQFGGSETVIYDLSTQPYPPCRGVLETPVGWPSALVRIFRLLLDNIKVGTGGTLIHGEDEVKFLRETEGHIYPEMEIIWYPDDDILRVEDLQWFSPEVMQKCITLVSIYWAKQTGQWPTSPKMMYWYHCDNVHNEDGVAGLHYIEHQHATASQCRMAQKLRANYLKEQENDDEADEDSI